MAFKINVSDSKGRTYKLEAEAPALIGKELKQTIQGNDISEDLSGYEFMITGASDKAGFTAMEDVQGQGLNKVLLSYGKGFKKRPKHEGKKKRSNNRPKGLRLRKTVRGSVLSEEISQINLKVTKEGDKSLKEIFPDQNKTAEPEPKKQPATEDPVEEKKEEVKEEKAKETPKAETNS